MEVLVDVPVRVCDVGGWTDTWFAGHGRVCSLAVRPAVSLTARAEPGDGRITFELADYDLTFAHDAAPPDHHLLAAAVGEAGDLGGVDATVRISSAVPPGCSLGTSAAVSVGVIAALDALRGDRRPPAELASAAHRAEAGRLGRESGVQDQVAAASGGVSLIEVPGYPHTERHGIPLHPTVWDALDRRLLHIAYGGPHDSSTVHREVIAALEAEGHAAPRLETLRRLATDAYEALRFGDLRRYGGVLTDATDAQAALHPALVSSDARTLIEAAQRHGAVGWKVNGAGGAGGSISILCRSDADRSAISAEARRLGHVPLALSLAPAGVRVVAR